MLKITQFWYQMKWTMMVGCLFYVELFHLSAQTAQDYHKAYPKDFQEALDFLVSQKGHIQHNLQKNQTDLKIVISTVFPEIVRYSTIQNLLETASLELLYVRFGGDYANFSIGRFQMKPTFVEALERYVRLYTLKSLIFITEFASTDPQYVRQERIKRLKDLTWQLHYLSAFYHIVSKKFDLQSLKSDEKVRFFAAAFNRGFEHKKEEIIHWSKVSAFPFGLRYKGKQYNYTEIAYYFFSRYVEQIFK